MRILLILVSILVSPLWVSAQTTSGFLQAVAPLEVTPSYPGPREPVTVKLNDYRSSLFGADITWFVNDTQLKESTNRREITILNGNIGTQTTVKAVLKLPDGRQETVSTILRPLYLDIIIEPQTHVPDFYPGRSLPSIGSVVNVTALIEGIDSVKTALVYTWRVNQTVLQGGAIRGGNKVSFTVPLGQTLILSLEVARVDGTVVAQRSISLPSVRPEVHFYEVNLLYGVSNKASGNEFNFISNSATLRAEPYYLDSRIFNTPNVLTWEIDGNVVPNTIGNPYEITFQKTAASGESTLDFLVRSTSELLQIGRASIDIKY